MCRLSMFRFFLVILSVSKVFSEAAENLPRYLGHSITKQGPLQLGPSDEALKTNVPLLPDAIQEALHPHGIPTKAPLLEKRSEILMGTTEDEIALITKELVGSEATLAPRIDLFSKHQSFFDGISVFSVELTPNGPGKIVEGLGPIDAVRCRVANLPRSIASAVEKWCKRHINWISLASPIIVNWVRDMQYVVWKLYMQSEVVCNNVQADKYLDSAVRATEIIWGRFSPLGGLPLTSNMHSVLTQWSRIVIVHSAKMDQEPTTTSYYIKKYLLASPEGHSVLPHFGSLKCHIRPFLQGATRLQGFDVIWPSYAEMETKEWSFIPICLAIYPLGSLVSFDSRNPTDNGRSWKFAKLKREIFSCTSNGFVRVEGIPPRRSPNIVYGYRVPLEQPLGADQYANPGDEAAKN